jgi:hypothetical protein
MGAVCITNGGNEKFIQIFVGKSEEKRPLGRHKSRWGLMFKEVFKMLGVVMWAEFTWHTTESNG